MNYDEDLDELDKIWPIGKMLNVPDGGTVLVAGAYRGRYMDYVASRYKPGLVVGFEPQVAEADRARLRLLRHGERTVVKSQGIGVHDCLVTMDEFGTDGCKVCTGDKGHAVRLVSIDSILDEYEYFDLFICNMEGCELMLLPYLCASDGICDIDSLAVQFHSRRPQCWHMLSDHYGAPVHDDFPTWCLFSERRKKP